MRAHNYKISSRLKLHSRSGFSKIIAFLVALSIAIALLLHFSPTLKGKLSRSYDSFSFGVYSVINAFNQSIISKKNGFFNYINLEGKYRNLESENLNLKSQVTNYQQILTENEYLKKLMKYSVNNPKKILTTKFFAQSVDGYVNFAKIPVGNINGIKENDIVVEGERLVGRVTEVEEHYSRVILLTSPDLKLPVFFTSTNVKAVLRGTQDGKLLVSILNVNNLLPQKDELVVTSGDGYHFPSGIAVGIVTRSEPDYIEITPFFNYKKVDIVSILRD